MTDLNSSLFKALTIGSLTINGRLFKSATSETRASESGFVTDEYISFYELIARAGTPLIITGNMHVSREGQSTARMCGIESDDKIQGLKKLTDTVHKYDAKIFAQLNHVGRQMIPANMGFEEAIAPSAVCELTQGTIPRAMTQQEIKRVINDFADAAVRAQRAGFDGIQLHAAHGYLISQFLTPYTNRRNDEYGGSFENRLRFLKQICHEVRERVGRDYPVIVKLNGIDSLPLRRGLKNYELVKIGLALQQSAVDAIEISISHYESGGVVFRGSFHRFFNNYRKTSLFKNLPLLYRWGLGIFWPFIALLGNILWCHKEGFNLRYAKAFASSLDIPILCVGGFQERRTMEKALGEGVCDAVSSARQFIADPFFYKHIKQNIPGPKCRFCNACVGYVGEKELDCFHPKVRIEKNLMLAKEKDPQALTNSV